ncbi:hypothetical protein FACS1894132_13110 [Clostridia bacterium]|nr:hypothetical protein FACS1894132_13110 [Clostridia bacterium]
MARKSRKNITEEQLPKIYNTAIYARLSKNNVDEVIETQIEICKEFVAKRPFFKLISTYADNGYSGTNFERPQFVQLMEAVRNGKINCIIVKDLSRFGRNHIAVGDYLNNIFPFLEVRFIAISDSYDNINIEPDEYFITSFKNFAHAHYAMETSRKCVNAKRELTEQGKFIGSHAPYGYKKSPNDKHILIIDEKIAPYIREIFARFLNGEKTKDICADFTKRKIPTPSMLNSGHQSKEIWTTPMINTILTNERYIGTFIGRQNSQAFYKNEEKIPVKPSEQLKIENVFPVIINREIFDKVQEMRHKKGGENT